MSNFELNDDDVVSMEHPGFDTGQTFKIRELKAKVRAFASIENKNGYPNRKSHWFMNEGVECEILTTQGGGWRRGKLRFSLEFIPDNPEDFIDNPPTVPPKTQSPLSDLRSNLNV